MSTQFPIDKIFQPIRKFSSSPLISEQVLKLESKIPNQISDSSTRDTIFSIDDGEIIQKKIKIQDLKKLDILEFSPEKIKVIKSSRCQTPIKQTDNQQQLKIDEMIHKYNLNNNLSPQINKITFKQISSLNLDNSQDFGITECQQDGMITNDMQKILVVVRKIDQILHLSHQRNKPTFIYQIQENMDQKTIIKIVLQVKHIYPEFFQLSYQKCDKKNETLLHLRLPQSYYTISNQSYIQSYFLKRIKDLHSQFILKIKEHHRQFLNKLQFDITQIEELEKNNQYHKEFDLHKIQPPQEGQYIKQAMVTVNFIKASNKYYQYYFTRTLTNSNISSCLPSKPCEFLKTISIKEFLTKNKTTNQLIQESVDKIYSNSSFHNQNSSQNSLLSDKILFQIKEKEKILKMQEIAHNEQSQFSNKKKELKTIAQIIKLYYQKRKVSNMFHIQVIDHIAQVNHSFITNKIEIKNYLQTLCQILPNWIQIVEKSTGKIVKLSKQQELSQIYELIDKATIKNK